MRKVFVAVIATMLLLALTACSSDESTGGGESNRVAVTLDDFSIDPEPTSVPAGPVTFEVENVGPAVHEMVVIRSDIDPADIPVENHEADEEASGMTPIGEVEDVQVGESMELKLTLEAGSYVLLCNIKKHFERGMVTEFQVT
jgi:uncharacterized cupredoxin-like copper-binding protein